MKIMLPKVQVKGVPGISRAIINQSATDNSYSLIVEGSGTK